MKNKKINNGDSECSDRRLIFEDFLACRLKVLIERMDTSLIRTHEDFDLSKPAWMLMALLAQYETEVSSTIVKKSTAMDKSRINRTLTRMVEKKIIIKRENPEDKRAYNLRLSAKGKKEFTKVERLGLEWGDAFIKGITKAELESFESILTKLETNITAIDKQLDSKNT